MLNNCAGGETPWGTWLTAEENFNGYFGGDAEKMGIGIITDARWKRTYDTMVGNGLLKADVDFRQAYTTQFVRDLKVMP